MKFNNVFFTRLSFGVFFLFILVLPKYSLSNAAQPGIWSSGGVFYTLLYPEDSSSFKKIKMQEEKIYIQIYKGFAVVKGTYHFFNTTNETISLKMGYPINGIYHHGSTYINVITVDSLAKFKVKVDEKFEDLITTNLNKSDKDVKDIYSFNSSFVDNWKVWQINFAPNQTKNVEVYFIVNTNIGRIRDGYSSKSYNAFIYLLESGSVWHQPIEKGDFYIQLMDHIKKKDVHGISQGFDFQYNHALHLFWGNKRKFSPTETDNLVLTYHKKVANFNFKTIVLEADNYFNTINQFSNLNLNSLSYEASKIGSPYKLPATAGNFLVTILIIGVLLLPYIFGILLILLIVYIIWKFIKKKKKNEFPSNR